MRGGVEAQGEIGETGIGTTTGEEAIGMTTGRITARGDEVLPRSFIDRFMARTSNEISDQPCYSTIWLQRQPLSYHRGNATTSAVPACYLQCIGVPGMAGSELILSFGRQNGSKNVKKVPS